MSNTRREGSEVVRGTKGDGKTPESPRRRANGRNPDAEQISRDQLFRATAARATDFEFNEQVADVFDDMLCRSIPMYLEQQHMIQELAGKFWIPGSNIYDLGCSTGTTLCNIARAISKGGGLVGFDNSRPMLRQAGKKIREQGLGERISVHYGDLNGDVQDLKLDKAGVVTMCWTLQFVRPLNRERVIRWIYNSLVAGGVLIITEKVLTNSSHMNRFFIDLYYQFKKRNQYSSDEIRRKREALENVLVPYRTDENLELFRRCGFQIVETFFQWYNFAGYLCMKTPAPNYEG
jgi:tRNA (cmo5U34)-methyltransferase